MMKHCFILFLTVASFLQFSTFSSKNAWAQTADSRLSGEKFVEALREDATSGLNIDALTEKYTPLVEQYSNLSSLDSRELIESLSENTNITDEALGKIADGFFNGENPFDSAELDDVKDVIEKLNAGLATLDEINNIAELLSQGKLNADLLKGLAELADFSNLQDLFDFGDLDVNELLLKGLADLGIEDPTAVLSQLDEILGDTEAIQNLINNPSELFSSEQLQEYAPDLFSAFESLAGASAAVAILGGLFDTGLLSNFCPPLLCTEANECGNCSPEIINNHIEIRNHVSIEFFSYGDWFISDFWNENLSPALGLMTKQLMTTSMQQVQIIGTFFDAKHQLETQRMFQQMSAQAHSKYHPDEQLCSIGTNTRSFANSRRRADLAKATVATRMMDRQLNRKDGISGEGDISDIRSRIDIFIRKYCDKNGGGKDTEGTASLALLCKDASGNSENINADVIYTQTIENQLTLDVNFDGDMQSDVTDDEENIFALGANLFANETLPVIEEESIATNGQPNDIANFYYDLRSMAAKRSVAQNSYASIVGLRAEGDPSVAPFLKAILSEMNIPDDAVEEYLGENPSLFAQEEVMMKLLYQDPSFHANLYTTPENVDRINASLLALEIVQDRNIYESLLRSEATLATMIETIALKQHRRISSDLGALKVDGRKRPVE